MKIRRLTALFTAFALMCSILVSASAANVSQAATSSQTAYTVAGNEISVSTVSYPDGRDVAIATGNGKSATATRIGNIIYVTETVDGLNSTYQVDLDNLPDTIPTFSVPYSTYETKNSTFWGVSCLRSWSEEAAHGLFWSMQCDNGQYSNYDEKNSTARGYGEAFWGNIVSMNSHFATAAGLVTAGVLAAMVAAAASAGTLTGAARALALIVAGIPAAGHVLDAKADALDANYNFDRFKAIT